MALQRGTINSLRPGDLAITGFPFDGHSSFLTGPSKAPDLIIAALESDSANYYTESLTDLNEHPRIKWCGNVSARAYHSFNEPIEEILSQNAIPVSLGGDHSISYPILKGMASKYPELSILHFDAHGDLYHELDGNAYSHACPFARIMENGLAQHLTQLGIRTLTQHQADQAQKFGVRVNTMKDRNQLKGLDLSGPVYLSFDLDVLDPAFAPGVSHHEPGGYSTRAIIEIIQSLDLDIVGMDLVEYNPDRDLNGVTGMVAAKVLKELLDKIL